MNTPVEVESSCIITGPLEEVWGLVADFNNIPFWHPAVKESRIESGLSTQAGAVRALQLRDGMRLRERLIAISAPEHFYTYSVIESPLPIRDHESTVKLASKGNAQTEVTWSARFIVTAGDATTMANGVKASVLDLGLQGLRDAVMRSQQTAREEPA